MTITDIDHFADLAAEISCVMGTSDTTVVDHLLTLSGLKKENKGRRKRQTCKLRKLASRREIYRKDFEDKLILAQMNKVVDTSWRDIADRKTFVDTTFTCTFSFNLFIDDLRTDMTAR